MVITTQMIGCKNNTTQLYKISNIDNSHPTTDDIRRYLNIDISDPRAASIKITEAGSVGEYFVEIQADHDQCKPWWSDMASHQTCGITDDGTFGTVRRQRMFPIYTDKYDEDQMNQVCEEAKRNTDGKVLLTCGYDENRKDLITGRFLTPDAQCVPTWKHPKWKTKSSFGGVYYENEIQTPLPVGITAEEAALKTPLPRHLVESINDSPAPPKRSYLWNPRKDSLLVRVYVKNNKRRWDQVIWMSILAAILSGTFISIMIYLIVKHYKRSSL